MHYRVGKLSMFPGSWTKSRRLSSGFSEVPHSRLTALAGVNAASQLATGEVLLQNDCESGLGLKLMDIVACADSWV
jgi:hypothetical protein